MTSTEDLTKLVNAAGFGLQLALENAVDESSQQHNFEIEAREQPWRREGLAGFIDLVLGRSNLRLICECKRSRDADWVFLREEDRQNVDRVRLLWQKHDSGDLLGGWHDFHLTTTFHESAFCVVRGHGENDVPMLERIANKLILSVEALAAEESQLLDDDDDIRVYVPIIVTTANLWVCRYAPQKIDLKTGLISDAAYERVDVLAFRKALTTNVEKRRSTDEMAYRAFRRLSLEQDRTVLVINAASFISALLQWQPAMMRENYPAPWEGSRRRT